MKRVSIIFMKKIQRQKKMIMTSEKEIMVYSFLNLFKSETIEKL